MTVSSGDVAESVVSALVSERLIACGNITMPLASLDRWRGETERASEVLVIMKTAESARASVAISEES